MTMCCRVGAMLQKQASAGRWIAAVCAGTVSTTKLAACFVPPPLPLCVHGAATTVLKQHGIGLGQRVTSHPGVKADVEQAYAYQDERVVRDGRLITSRGPGKAWRQGFAITSGPVSVLAAAQELILPSGGLAQVPPWSSLLPLWQHFKGPRLRRL